MVSEEKMFSNQADRVTTETEPPSPSMSWKLHPVNRWLSKSRMGSGRWSIEVPLRHLNLVATGRFSFIWAVFFLSPSRLPSHFGYIINLAFNLS